MAGAGGIRAGAAFIEMWLNDNRVVRGLKVLSAKLKAFGATVTAIGIKMLMLGAGVAVAFIPAIRAASRMEETMAKFNVVFGANAKAVKAWSDTLAAKVGRSKQQIADFMASSQDLFVPMGFDAAGATDISKQLTALAVDLASFNNKADADVLRDLHAAMTGSGEVMKKYGVLLSQTAVNQELMNLGLDPKRATEQQKAQARLNIILAGTKAAQGDAVRSGKSFANQWKRLLGILDNAAVAMGSALLPQLSKFVNRVGQIVSVAGTWISKNKGLVVGIAKLAIALMIGGAAAVAIGAVFSGLGAIIGGVVSAIGLIGAGIALLVKAFLFLISPIGLVIAALVGLAAWFLTSTKAGGDALAWLGDRFKALRETATAAWGGIADALAAGDIKLAAKILWLTLKMEWQKGVHFLNKIWQSVATFFVKSWTGATFKTSKLLVNANAAMAKGWTESVDFMLDAWTMFTTALSKGWRTLIGFIAAGWQKLKGLVTGEDTSDAQDKIWADVAAGNETDQDAQNDALNNRDKARRKNLQDIEDRRTGTLSELDDEEKRRNADRDKAHDASLAGTQQDIDEAKAEWQRSVDDAKAKRADKEWNDAAVAAHRANKPKALPTIDELTNKVGDGMGVAQRAAETKGTFSAFAVRGMQAGGPAERTAKATEKTAESTHSIDEQMAENRGVLFTT